jgi:hypothetical protein
MQSMLEKTAGLWREVAARFAARFERGPIATADALNEFASTRAAFVTQKKLYGYLKTRMGTRYPSMFDDDAFVESINLAKMHIFAASLSDLTIFTTAYASAGDRMDAEARMAMAADCYRSGVADNRGQLPHPEAEAAWIAVFERRLERILWENAAGGEGFTESPKALVEWAPIAPELKRLDAEIVENSIRFAWIEVRKEYRRRVDGQAVCRDWEERRG